MINPWWSVALTVIGVTGLYLVTRKLWIGFVVGVSVQVLWIVYAVATEQWGFLGSALAYGWVNALGLRRWLRDRDAPARRAHRAQHDYARQALAAYRGAAPMKGGQVVMGGNQPRPQVQDRIPDAPPRPGRSPR